MNAKPFNWADPGAAGDEQPNPCSPMRNVQHPIRLGLERLACVACVIGVVTNASAAASEATTESSATPAQAPENGAKKSEAAEVTPDRPRGLTLQEAVREALSNSFESRLANVSVNAVRGDAKAFTALANPAVSFGVGRALGYDANLAGGQASPNQYSVGVSDNALLSNFIAGKYQLRRDMAKQMIKAAGLQRDAAMRLVALTVKQQFCEVVLAQARVKLAERILTSALRTERLVRDRYNAGAPLPDLLRAEAVTVDARQDLSAAQSEMDAQLAQLTVFLGRRSVHGLALDESLLMAPMPKLPELEASDTWVDTARGRRPDRAAAETAVQEAEGALSLARRNRWPDLELQLGYTQQGLGNNAIQPSTVSVSVSAPLPVLYQNQGEIERATGDVQSRTLERRQLDYQIETSVHTSLVKVNAAWKRVQLARERLLKARQAFAMVQLQYQEGATSLVDLLEATRALSESEDNYLASKEAAWLQLFQLEYDSGRELLK